VSDVRVALERAQEKLAAGDFKKALAALENAFYNWGQAESQGELDLLVELLTRISNEADGRIALRADGLIHNAKLRRDDFGVRDSVRLESAPRWRTGMPVATTPFLSGYQVLEYVGEVFGVVVRSRGAFAAFGAGLKSIVGGELRTMTNLLDRSRREAVDRMVEEAEERGADAIISMRFDADSIADGWTEICAYGTAVRARPEPADPSVEAATASPRHS
jgi:uncharacterized protein YbjQ (UPF0145 family)